jgi:Undecaprenyl-phosphate glucose phosphotransferase
VKDAVARQIAVSADARPAEAFQPRLAASNALQYRSPDAARDVEIEASAWPGLLRSPILLVIDFALVIFLGFAAGVLYAVAAGIPGAGGIQNAGDAIIIAILYCAVQRLLLGSSSLMSAPSGLRRLRVAVVSWSCAFLFFGAMVFVLKSAASVSRGAIISFFMLGLPAVTAAKILVPKVLARAIGARAFGVRNAIVIANKTNHRLFDTLRQLQFAGFSSSVLSVDANAPEDEWASEQRNLLCRAIKTAHKCGPGAVFIAAEGISHERLKSIAAGLGRIPRAIHVFPDRNTAELLRNRVHASGGAISIEIQKEPLNTVQRAAKRCIDLVASAVLLFLAAPVLLLIAVGIKLDSPGPVFFLQKRKGLCGRQFRIFKFRTMRVLEDGSNVIQVRRNDPRVTRFGSWLRKTSLDELPQLFNVFNGDMSLVGPRPHAIAHDEIYSELVEHYEVRQHMKPGVTGWAQVNGCRGETPDVQDMVRRIEYDLWYARNATVRLDLQILLKTVVVVFRQRHAY